MLFRVVALALRGAILDRLLKDAPKGDIETLRADEFESASGISIERSIAEVLKVTKDIEAMMDPLRRQSYRRILAKGVYRLAQQVRRYTRTYR